jgi:hypothetical protein
LVGSRRKSTISVDFLLGLVAAGDVGKGDGVGRFVHHARAALAEGEGAALAAALHLAHEEDPDADQQQHREPGDEDAGEEGLLLLGLGHHLDVVLQQVGHHPQVGRRVGRDALAVGGGRFEGAALDHHLGDAALLHLFEELGVFERSERHLARIELIEHRHQDDADHQPDRHIFEHVIQGGASLSLGRDSLYHIILVPFDKPCKPATT